jgi:hypothetical protein
MSITSANASIVLWVPGLFPIPQQIQGFAVDDVFRTDPLKSADTMRGVDGKLTGGYVYSDIKQGFSLMGDSASIDFFDQWNQAQQSQRETFQANGIITLPSVGKKWTMVKGFLIGFPIIPDAKKVLQSVTFQIEWESMSSALS